MITKIKHIKHDDKKDKNPSGSESRKKVTQKIK